jgi:hypothetical protein
MAGCGLGLWLLLCLPAYLLDGGRGLLFCSVAAGLCLAPAVASLALGQWATRGSPDLVVAAVFGGMGLRMVFVLGVGMLLFLTIDFFQLGRFWIWIIVFYLATLTLEVILAVSK